MFQGLNTVYSTSSLMLVSCICLLACDSRPIERATPQAKPAPPTVVRDAPQTLKAAEDRVRATGARVNQLVRLLAAKPAPQDNLNIARHFVGHFLEGVPKTSMAPYSFGGFTKEMRRLLGTEALRGVGCQTKVRQVGTTLGSLKASFKIHCAAQVKEPRPCATQVEGWLSFIPGKDAWTLTRSEIRSAHKSCAERAYFVDATEKVGLSHLGPAFHAQGQEATHWQGAASGDVNGDGRWDIFVPGRKRNHLYLNTADSGFVEVAKAWGVAQPAGGTGVVFFDYDNDGDQDLFVGYPGAHPTRSPGGVRAFRNERQKSFIDRSTALGFTRHHAAYPLVVLDANNDGYLDLYVGAYGHLLTAPNNSWVNATNGEADALYLNQGGRLFRLTGSIGGNGFTYAAGAVDIDRDGTQDIYAGHDFGPNALYRNEGGSTFSDQAGKHGLEAPGNAMGVTFADFDSDGRLDVIVTHMSSTAGDRILRHVEAELPPEHLDSLRPFASGNAILLRRGATFRPLPAGSVGLESGWAWGPAVADFDLDGDLDLYVANGYITGQSPHDT
jgi:hypothetical protein